MRLQNKTHYGVIAVFISQGAVIKYFGAAANKWLAYLIASVSGSIAPSPSTSTLVVTAVP